MYADAITIGLDRHHPGGGRRGARSAYPLDGEDLLPVCTGQRGVYDRALFWRTQAREAARVGNWKYIKDAGAEHLFDLSSDAGEKADLRTRHAAIFEEIRQRYLSWNATMLPLPRRTALE